MPIIRYIFIAIILAAGIGFACLNAEWVNVDFYFSIYHLPLSILLVLSLGVGILMGFLVHSIRYFSLKKENRHLKNQLKLMRQEVSNLRIMPLKND